METRVALQALSAKKDHIALAVDAGTLSHKPSIMGVRRLKSLPIALG
jgi:hypothetical protein